MKNFKIEYRNRLPHIAPIGAKFFITFRLGDSLPRQIINQLENEFKREIERLKKLKGNIDRNDRYKLSKIIFKKYDHQLDNAPYGGCYLNIPEVAKIVTNKLHSLDGNLYDLIAYTIMPNHVHLLIDTSIQLVDENNFFLPEVPENYKQLDQIMKLIKGGSARQANKVLGRKGQFWQKDSYDHYIRNDIEFNNVINYILKNPVKAGLSSSWKDYQYSYLRKEI